MSKKKKIQKPLIILTAGGTGGHIYPAEALAEELEQRNYRLLFVSDKRGLDNYHGNLSKIPNISVSSGPLMGKSKWLKIKNLIKTMYGIIQSIRLLLKKKPACVIGFGGYASFPCSVAAILLGIDLIIHEQNSMMSRTNRFLSKYATFVATSFKKTKYAPSGRKTVLIGMPIRQSITALYNQPRPKISKNLPFNILIIGGSQGAKIFSDIIPQAIKLLSPKQQKKIHITQQCREEDINHVQSTYNESLCKVDIKNFFNNMPELYNHHHLIISRAGASSIFEIEASGIASILVPLPTAADDHQTVNAAEIKNNKSGIVLSQKDFTPSTLSVILNDLLQNPTRLKTMSENAKKSAIIDASKRFADALESKILISATAQTGAK